MAIKYKKNPSVEYEHNPFGAPTWELAGFTFVPLNDLSEEQIKKLSFAAFSWEEWNELPLSWQLHIWDKDPYTKRIKRLDIEEDYDINWEDLDEEIQDRIYENDRDSQQRIELLAQVLADHTPTDDDDYILSYSESTIDYHMTDEQFLWDNFGEELIEKLEEELPDYYFTEVDVRQAAMEYGFTQDNFSFNLVSYGLGHFSADAPGYYLERDFVKAAFPDKSLAPNIQPDLMPKDEIEKALELAEDLNEHFSNSNIRTDEVYDLIHGSRRWDAIERETDHDLYSIEMDPHWDDIVDDVVRHLDLDLDPEEGEEKEPRPHYEESIPEERVLFKGYQIGSPDDIVNTNQPFALGDTYYALDLIPSELKKETKRGRNCVGREENGYPRALREGRIRLLSIRPETEENAWKRTYLMELVLDAPDMTSSLQEIVDRGGILRVEQIKGYNNRVPGFDRSLYAGGESHKWVSPEEAEALLKIVNKLNVQYPHLGTDTQNYILPALQGVYKKNPAQACPVRTPRGERPYSFNVHTKN